MQSKAGGGATGHLSISGVPLGAPAPLAAKDVGDDLVDGQFSAVVNVHGCNLAQVEVALAANGHEVDPHPAPGMQGKYISRHPVYIVAYDYSNLDANGLPTVGAPTELDLATIRKLYSNRYPHVAATAPPEDASHIDVPGMHIVAERDSQGRPTGRVMLGMPDMPDDEAR